MRKLANILAHATIMFAFVFLTLLVINIFNPAMQFLSSGVTNVFLWMFCFCGAALGIVTVINHRRYQQYVRDKAAAAARARRQNAPYPLRPPAQRR
jgi:uncharacterized membrane protein YqjE